MSVMNMIRAAVRPLRSRKVRVAVATVLTAYASEYGLGVSEEIVLAILGVGVALILGIAHEDNGRRSQNNAAWGEHGGSPRRHGNSEKI